MQYDQDYMGNFKGNEALHFYSKENTFFNKINLQSSVIILPDDDLHQFIHLLASCKIGTGSFLGVRCGQGVTLTPHPLLVLRSTIE